MIFIEVRYHTEVPATPLNTANLLAIGTSVSADRFRFRLYRRIPCEHSEIAYRLVDVIAREAYLCMRCGAKDLTIAQIAGRFTWREQRRHRGRLIATAAQFDACTPPFSDLGGVRIGE